MHVHRSAYYSTHYALKMSKRILISKTARFILTSVKTKHLHGFNGRVVIYLLV